LCPRLRCLFTWEHFEGRHGAAETEKQKIAKEAATNCDIPGQDVGGAFKYIYVLCFGVDLLRSFDLLDFKNNMLKNTFSVASLMATASISSTTWKEEVEKERRKTQELQNKLQEASAMQAEKRNLSAPFLQTLQVWLSNIWQGTSLCFSAGLVSCSRF